MTAASMIPWPPKPENRISCLTAATPMAGFARRTNSPTTIVSAGTGFPSATSRSYFAFSMDFVRK